MKSRVISNKNAEVLANIITLVGAKKQIEALPQKLRDVDDLFLPIRKEIYKQVKKMPEMFQFMAKEKPIEHFDPKGKDDRYGIRTILKRLNYLGNYYRDAEIKASQLVFDLKEDDTIDQVNHASFYVKIYDVPKSIFKAEQLSVRMKLFTDSVMSTDFSYRSDETRIGYASFMDEFIKAKVKIEKEFREFQDKLVSLSIDIKSNINKMRTTNKVIENWPEVEPLVLQMYGEEDSKSAPEVPLGNIINRHLLQITDQSGATA